MAWHDRHKGTMREIVFDTETTGLSPNNGDRICEIAAIELVDYVPTDNVFHVYVNPGMPMPAKAEEIHGLSDAFLKDKPPFEALATDWLAFIGDDSRLIAHNAMFDMGFVNAELGRAGHEALSYERVLDTLAIARRKHPGAENSLDALCNRYAIDLSARTKHNALLDTQLLAEVYIELIGARQKSFALGGPGATRRKNNGSLPTRTEPLAERLSDEEKAAHAAFVETLGEHAVWHRYGDLLNNN